jgi:hypothetical protein
VLSGGPRCPSGPSRVGRLRLELALLGWLFPFVMVLAWSADASAYAWMIRHGYTKCETCHTDPSGGEALNHMGRVQSEMLLSHDWGNESVTSDAKLLYALDEPDMFRAGGALRGMGIYKFEKDQAPSDFAVFPMQMDVYGSGDFGMVKVGASIGVAKVTDGSGYVQAAQVTRGTEGYTMISRSHWLGFDLGESWLLRLGRLNLPFGVRTSEHTLFVRKETGTDRESDQQHGAALAYSGGKWRGEGMFVLGNFQVAPDDYRERGFSGYLEYLLASKLAVGVSSLVLQSAKSLFTGRQERTIRHVHGATLRYSPIDDLAVLGELNAVKTSGSKLGYAGFLNGDYELLRGLHLAATGEVFDGGRRENLPIKLPGAGEMNYGLWGTVQWFFYTHWDLRVDAVLRKGAATSVQTQLHMYF